MGTEWAWPTRNEESLREPAATRAPSTMIAFLVQATSARCAVWLLSMSCSSIWTSTGTMVGEGSTLGFVRRLSRYATPTADGSACGGRWIINAILTPAVR